MAETMALYLQLQPGRPWVKVAECEDLGATQAIEMAQEEAAKARASGHGSAVAGWRRGHVGQEELPGQLTPDAALELRSP